jgi:hypothetical protein
MTHKITNSLDSLFQRLDQLVQQLEDEGFPYELIVGVLRDYVELSDEYLLK